MKRETKLKKRRQNAEELLAWKQRLDEEEKHVAHMEHEVLHLWDGAKRKIKPTAATPSAPASSQSPARDTTVRLDATHLLHTFRMYFKI